MDMEERLDKIERKFTIVFILLGILIFLNILVVGGLNNNDTTDTSEETETSEYNTEYDVSDFKEITYEDLSDFKKNNTYVVYIGRETCSWCAAMLPTLKQASIDYDYTTYYIDIAKIIDYSTGKIIDNDAYEALVNLDTTEEQSGVMDEFGSTPMILIMKNNKIIASQVGYDEYDAYASILESAGLKIKE